MALKGQRTTASYLEWDSMLILLQKLERDKQYKFQLLFAVGCYTGLRIGDLLKLRWKDVYMVDTLNLVEGKTGKLRKIMLNPALVEIIDRLHEKLSIRNDEQFLFVNKAGNKAINIQYVNRKLKEIVKAYNLKVPNNAVSTHIFRKSLGRHHWEINNYSEKSLLLLSELFNHSGIGVTKRYLGIREEEVGDVYLSL